MSQPVVLIVEDNQLMRTMLRVTLEAEGYAVLEAGSGAEAVARMAAGPDLVLQDLALPDVDGLELVKRLRALPTGAAIPILAVSGFLAKLESLRPGGDFTAIVTKPVEPSHLAEIVRSYLPIPGESVTRSEAGRTCLVVDDDDVQLKLLATHLEQAGFRVMTAHDASQALDIARVAQPDVIVSDVLMPGMDGFELCVAARNDPALADIPLVLTSVAYTEELDTDLATMVGADALVTRLPDGQTVVAAALNALGRPRTRPTSPPPVLPTAQYTHRVVRQLERQAVLNQSLTRRLGWLDAELSVLSGISESLTAGAPADAILEELLYRCLDASGASAGAAYLRAADGRPRVRATFGAERRTAALVRALRSPRLASRLVDSAVPLLVPSRELHGRQVDRLLETVEAASLIVAPIILGHEQVGTLVMASTARGFAEDWLAFARIVGRQIGQAIGLIRTLDLVRGERERLGRIVETVPDGLMIVGLDRRIRFVNAAATRIFGRSPAELIGRDGDDLNWQMLNGDGRPIPVSERVTTQVPKTGTAVYGVERTVARPDGVRVSLLVNAAPLRDPDGTITGSVVAFTDVTEQLRQQTALRESEERFRLLAERSTDLICRHAPDGTILYASPACERLLGYRVDEFVGRSARWMVVPEDHPIVDGAHRAVLVGGQSVTATFRAQTKGGHTVWLESTLTPVHEERTGELLELHTSSRDVTARVQAEHARQESSRLLQEALAELQATQQRVVQQERLRAMGEMSSGIAHDFNNALAIVLGYSDLLLADPTSLRDAERARQAILAINVAAHDAAAVVSRLREFYRERDPREEHAPVDLAEIADQTIEITRPKWQNDARARGATIEVRKQIVPARPVLGDPSELRAAMVNLIINAVDAMPTGGTLTLGVREEGGSAVLEVRDTGIGMSEETRRRCLEPFYTTKGEQGTGLGLPAVYGIVNRHGGTVEIISAPHHGAWFQLRFPITARDLPAHGAPAGVRDALASLHVLLVDDHPQIRGFLSVALRSDGHTVEEAVDGADALRTFATGRFDLVVTDQSMPGMNGLELAARLKERSPQTPIVLLTGFGEIMNTSGQQPPFVDLVVGKPITLTRLREAVGRACPPPIHIGPAYEEPDGVGVGDARVSM